LGAGEKSHDEAKALHELAEASASELRERLYDAVLALDKDTRHPVSAAEFAGGVRKGVPGTFEQAKAKRLKELRHEDDVTAALNTNFFDELGETGGGRDVQDSVLLAAVTVAAGDDRKASLAGEFEDCLIFFFGTKAV
jgi:hypothetical protein